MSDLDPNAVEKVLNAATRQGNRALAAADRRRQHDAQPNSQSPVAHGPAPPDVRRNDHATP